ncbi:MAG: LysR family transcriptional regulator [Megasphaera sp.]|nr:LysR family transcriptional regulator [Megasphaera sp.]
MISRYCIFCKVMELKSFTNVARELGYSQSAVSQSVKALEEELDITLLDRGKDGIKLTKDGELIYPYIRNICTAEQDLTRKQMEIKGLFTSTIRIGTFSSISRTILPPLMKRFTEKYPHVEFVLHQGDFTSIEKWIREGYVDFGFINEDAASDMEMMTLYQEDIMAVLPEDHPLTNKTSVTMADLAKEPFILLDEGDYNVPMRWFRKENVTPHIIYEIFDDYSIISMVHQGLGVSALFKLMLKGFSDGVAVRPIEGKPNRTIAMAWQKWDSMPYAARTFSEYILEQRPSSFKKYIEE